MIAFMLELTVLLAIQHIVSITIGRFIYIYYNSIGIIIVIVLLLTSNIVFNSPFTSLAVGYSNSSDMEMVILVIVQTAVYSK